MVSSEGNMRHGMGTRKISQLLFDLGAGENLGKSTCRT